jgi:excisionase family DNA binding protein
MRVPEDQPHSEHWVGVDDVAAHLGVRKDSVYRWIDGRGLPARKIGKLWKLKLSEVDAWVQAAGSRAPDELHPPHRGVAAPTTPARASEVRKPTILVVDDDEIICAALRAFLSDEGYESAAAADGQQALRLLRGGDCLPDLIILDLRMPVMDGWQFREEQLRDEHLARIPVILLSAERFATSPGVAAVLRKPLDLDRLADAMGRILALATDPT